LELAVDQARKRRLLEIIRKTADYQFGLGAGEILFPEDVDLVVSKRTGRVRQILLNGVLIATLNPSSGLLNLTIEGAERLCSNGEFRMRWVKVGDEASHFVEEGRDVFARHVIDADRDIRPFEEVIVLNSHGEIIAVGRALLSGSEMLEFKRGVAVRVRRGRMEKTKKGKDEE